MNNYYTLIYLNREIKEIITGGIFDFAISPHKDVLELYITTPQKKFRLIFSASAKETALFLDAWRPPKKRNVTAFFPGLEGEAITGTRLADRDRLLYVDFAGGRQLLFKLFSGHPNAYLVDGQRIADAFKSPDKVKGGTPPEPLVPEVAEEVSPRRTPKNQLTELNPLLPRNLLPYLVEQHRVGSMSAGEVKEFCHAITKALLEDPHPRVLRTGDFCLWSRDWLDLPSEKECRRVNRCVGYAYKNAVHLRRLQQQKEAVEQLLVRTVAQKEALAEQLGKAGRNLERAEEYEKYGDLLMAHAHEEKQPGTGAITVRDLYEENKPLTIPLKAGKSIAGNAQGYYEKAKDARKSYASARERLPAVKQALQQARELLGELRRIEQLPELENWLGDRRELLADFGYGGEQKQASSPYRKFRAGKYEIWIGKDAASNDKLTTLAHKEDIWLHARGVAGSHVVIRMGNQKTYPPKEIILRAAGYAAWYSKARGMKTAPVMYTKRKYVRKPSGAGPGTAVVEREQVEMVPPVNPKNHGKP